MNRPASVAGVRGEQWGRVASVGVPAAVALAAGYAVAHDEQLAPAPLLVIAALVVVASPGVVTLGALVVCQEFVAVAPLVASLSATFGNVLYYGPGASNPQDPTAAGPKLLPVLGLVALASVVYIARARRQAHGQPLLDAFGVSVILTIAALLTWTTSVGYVAAHALPAAINQEGRPFLMLALGFGVGVGLQRTGGPSRADGFAVGAMLVVLCVLAVFGIATGETSLALTTAYPPFYDSATPVLAGSVLLGLLFHSRRRGGSWARWVVMAAALAVLVLGVRRNAWAAVVLVLAVTLVVAYSRRNAARRVALAVLVAVPALIAVPGIAESLGDRFYATLYSLSVNADESAQGHVRDLGIGWDAAVASPITGVGSRHPQLPGLAADQSPVVYVHNEWLLDWLRFGLVGVVLVVLLMLLLIVGAVRLIRSRRAATPAETMAAMFVLMLPISCVTAPFLSTTSRWPALTGIAAGVLAAGSAARARSLNPLADRAPSVPSGGVRVG